MRVTYRSTILASALIGTGLVSQAPEFAQQYRQRLGGAVEELRLVVEDFDRDARNSQLSRMDALEAMSRSTDRFTRDRGTSMQRAVWRYERLVRQQARLEEAPEIMRPLIVLRSPDSAIVEGAWRDFEPALPLTSAGAGYGGAGAVLLALLAWLGIGAGRRARRIASRRRKPAGKRLSVH